MCQYTRSVLFFVISVFFLLQLALRASALLHGLQKQRTHPDSTVPQRGSTRDVSPVLNQFAGFLPFFEDLFRTSPPLADYAGKCALLDIFGENFKTFTGLI